MSAKIRLTRMGSKKRPYYRIIVVDSRKKRDGAYLDNVGIYHPLGNDQTEEVEIKEDKIRDWLNKGAKPSPTVKVLLNKKGIQL